MVLQCNYLWYCNATIRDQHHILKLANSYLVALKILVKMIVIMNTRPGLQMGI